MRRSLFALHLLFLVALAGCWWKQRIEALPPAEVLHNAALASQNLQSASFHVEGNLGGGSAPGTTATLVFDGVLQNAGKQFQTHVQVAATMKGTQVAGEGELVGVGNEEIYLKVLSLTSSDEGLFRQELLGNFLNRWWMFPTATGAGSEPLALTPNPSLLRAQAEVIRVDTDHGIQTLRGRPAYHYSVSIDRDKLLQYLARSARERGELFDEEAVKQSLASFEGSGELWIDAETFYLLKVQWSLTVPGLRIMDLPAISFTMDLRDHNTAPVIDVPSGAVPFNAVDFMGIVDQPMPEETTLSPEEMEEFRRLLDETPVIP